MHHRRSPAKAGVQSQEGHQPGASLTPPSLTRESDERETPPFRDGTNCHPVHRLAPVLPGPFRPWSRR